MATPLRGQAAAAPFLAGVRAILFAGMAIGLAGGCSSPPTHLMESPLSVERQQQAVLEVVPIGTPRAEAERRLKAAGIEYTASRSQSMYYLSLWNRQDGERWHINVALLFDADGKLYSSRPADATVDRVSAAAVSAGQPGWRKAGSAGTAEAPRPVGPGEEDARVPFPGQADQAR